MIEEYRGEYAHMMGWQEDREEFFMRLAGAEPGVHPRVKGTPKAPLVEMFWADRDKYIAGGISYEERERRLDSLVRRMITLVGPVRPSSKLVGWF
jgi:hypothetical protein